MHTNEWIDSKRAWEYVYKCISKCLRVDENLLVKSSSVYKSVYECIHRVYESVSECIQIDE